MNPNTLKFLTLTGGIDHNVKALTPYFVHRFIPLNDNCPAFFTNIFGDMNICPICLQKLCIPQDALDMMCTSNENFSFDSKIKKEEISLLEIP
jgi:hypothetical protein